MNKTMHYIYIEDTNDATTESFRRALAVNGVNIELMPVQSFEAQIEALLEHKGLNGIILDLRLDENPVNETSSPVKYTAPALAQALRSKFAEKAKAGEIVDIPIILFSTDTNILNSYELDFASHDLFDFRMSKTASHKFQQYSKQLYSIANGYIFIKSADVLSCDTLLNFDSSLLDSRIFDGYNRKDLTAFEIAKRILKGLLFYDSPLIPEQTLAARLGLNISSPEWPEVKALFDRAKYAGVFSDAWNRWWMLTVNEIFQEISNGKLLSNLTAKERAAILSTCVGKDIVPAKPIDQSKSSRFWTICQCLQLPLDPSEGFRIVRINAMPWQDNQYISLKAALDRTYVGEFELEEIEKQRLKAIKDDLK